MSQGFAQRFIDSLERLESKRELDPMIELYSENCELGNVVVPDKFHGLEGAREFWKKYRDTFREIHSSFRNQSNEDGRLALEWTTEATGSEGQLLQYSGVSIVEISGDKITRFHAYIDAGILGRQIESTSTGS